MPNLKLDGLVPRMCYIPSVKDGRLSRYEFGVDDNSHDFSDNLKYWDGAIVGGEFLGSFFRM